jgi:hypothetical protein
MHYSNFYKLYEQDSQFNNSGVNNEVKKTANKDFAFPIDDNTLDQLYKLIAQGEGIWMSSEPLKYLNDDSDEYATIDNKPVYLMINLGNKQTDQQTSLSDRVYVVSNTNKTELSNNLKLADNYEDRVKVVVKDPVGKNRGIAIWKINGTSGNTVPVNTKQPETVETPVNTNQQVQSVKQDIANVVADAINKSMNQYTN